MAIEPGISMIAHLRREMGPEVVELLLKLSDAAPAELREWPPERVFQYIRCRFKFTQTEIGLKAGLTQLASTEN